MAGKPRRLLRVLIAGGIVAGGWFVTDRMLEMFKKRPEPKQESADT